MFAAALLLAAVVGFQFAYRLHEVRVPKARSRIAEIVPRTLPGGNVHDEMIGPTETASDAALKILNLDDYVYRRFEKGGRSFTVYAAYWDPGKMPTRLVASHTPDRCWTENGMRCVDMRFKQTYELNEKPLLPAEFRAFVVPGSGSADSSPVPGPSSFVSGPTYVAYWHTVEGKPYDYGDRFNAVPDPWLWWKDTLAQAAYGSREQLFVRIASTTPFDELWKDPGFQSVMTSVADLGLWNAAAERGRLSVNQ